MSEQQNIRERLRAWRKRMPLNWYGNPDLDAAADEIDRLYLQLVKAKEALEPFANGRLPSSRRSEIAYDRNGLRRAISPLELACDEAFRTLAALSDEQDKPAGCNHWPGQKRCGVCGMDSALTSAYRKDE